MMVMMMASTPSLKASRRLFDIACSAPPSEPTNDFHTLDALAYQAALGQNIQCSVSTTTATCPRYLRAARGATAAFCFRLQRVHLHTCGRRIHVVLRKQLAQIL